MSYTSFEHQCNRIYYKILGVGYAIRSPAQNQDLVLCNHITGLQEYIYIPGEEQDVINVMNMVNELIEYDGI